MSSAQAATLHVDKILADFITRELNVYRWLLTADLILELYIDGMLEELNGKLLATSIAIMLSCRIIRAIYSNLLLLV